MSARLGARDLLGVAASGVRTRRLRAALSALGIAIGIAAMVAVLGISSSSRADLLAQLDSLGTNLLRVTPGETFFGADAKLPLESRGMLRRIGPVQGPHDVQQGRLAGPAGPGDGQQLPLLHGQADAP